MFLQNILSEWLADFLPSIYFLLNTFGLQILVWNLQQTISKQQVQHVMHSLVEDILNSPVVIQTKYTKDIPYWLTIEDDLERVQALEVKVPPDVTPVEGDPVRRLLLHLQLGLLAGWQPAHGHHLRPQQTHDGDEGVDHLARTSPCCSCLTSQSTVSKVPAGYFESPVSCGRFSPSSVVDEVKSKSTYESNETSLSVPMITCCQPTIRHCPSLFVLCYVILQRK